MCARACLCACVLLCYSRQRATDRQRSERFTEWAKMQNNPSPQLPCKGILKTSRSFDKSGARWVWESARSTLTFRFKLKANNRFYNPIAAFAKMPSSTSWMCCKRFIRPTRIMDTWKSMSQKHPTTTRSHSMRTKMNWTRSCWWRSKNCHLPRLFSLILYNYFPSRLRIAASTQQSSESIDDEGSSGDDVPVSEEERRKWSIVLCHIFLTCLLPF